MSARKPLATAFPPTARAVRFAPAWRDQSVAVRPLLARFIVARPTEETPQ